MGPLYVLHLCARGVSKWNIGRGSNIQTYSIHVDTPPTYPLDSKFNSFEVYDGDGPIASLSNAPLHSLPGGEGQEGPLLKGSNTLWGGSVDEKTAPVNTVIHHTNTEDIQPCIQRNDVNGLH